MKETSMANLGKTKIIVAIPSYNEADSISQVASTVDLGLQQYFPKEESLIINIDSKSEDKTRRIFEKTKTKMPKISFCGGDNPRGKGINLFRALEYMVKNDFDLIATLDADLKSITPDWIGKLITPIVLGQADYTLPIYTRNRYEGSTTNHFCYPSLYAIFGLRIRQPIAGDFAFSRKIAEAVLGESKNSESYRYGIDIFLTATALWKGVKLQEIFLGRKIHKPSFGKMVPMFRQVVETLFFVLKQGKDSQYKKRAKLISHNQNVVFDEFVRKPERKSINERQKTALRLLKDLSIPKEFRALIPDDFRKRLLVARSLEVKRWTKLLLSFLEFAWKNDLPEQEKILAEMITPLFLLRVLSFYEEIEGLNIGEIQKIIDKQINIIDDLLAKQWLAKDNYLPSLK